MIKQLRLNKKKGFTLIELIVVLAVIGILALLAVPKFLSKTEQAKMTQIQHDIRVVEGKLNMALIDNPDTLKAWEPAEPTELTELVSENKLMGRGGLALGPPMGDVWVVDEEFLDSEVNTKLNGDFFVDTDGNVFYEHSKPVAPGKTETPPKLAYEEWLEKVQAEGYVLATDANFSGETDGEFKYIGSDNLVIVPNVIKGVDVTSYERMFEETSAKGVASYNPNITNMAYMFSNSYAPTLDVSRLNTTGVTDMFSMFYKSAATNLDLSSFNTANVTSMRSMFYDSQATSLDLSGFDTSQVTSMRSMFYNSQATSLDLSSFDTSQVTNMDWMFSGSQATSLDLSSFDTSQATSMRSMFSESQAKTLDLSGFNTSKVTDMAWMFSGSQATSLDLSSFDTSQVTNMHAMFQTSKETSLDLSSFNTANVTDMSWMFNHNEATSLDLSSFDTSKVADITSMFRNSNATEGIARTIKDANKFNNSSQKPATLTFTVKQ